MTELKSIKNYAKGIYEIVQRISNSLIDTKVDDTITFHLNSDQGIQKNSTNNANIDFQLSKPIFLNNSTGLMAIRSGSIPRSFYVVDGTNCKFNIIIDSTTYNIELLHGNYEARQLTTTIANLVNTATSSTPLLSITYSITNNKFAWTFASTSSTITLDTDVLHSAYKLLGEPKDQHLFTASGSNMVHTSENVVNVTQINTLQIHVGNMSFNDVINTLGKASNILHKVYFDQGRNSWQTIDEQSPDWKVINMSNTGLTFLNIYITSEDGEYIDFNGVPWELTISLKIIRN